MGGDLRDAPAGAVPHLLAYAARDPQGNGLSRLQLVKGWIGADGTRRVEVVDVAVGDGSGRAPGGGHDQLCAIHRDESFDPDRPAYYYLRVVEVPSPRWSVFDCERLPGAERPPVCSDGSYPATVREMAWTSPVWYRP